jgi:hypothetical protein
MSEMSIRDKFDNLIIAALPEFLQSEFETIREGTLDFTDDEFVEIWQKNFNYIYSIVKGKYPFALKDYIPPFEEPEELEPELTAEQLEKIQKATELAQRRIAKKQDEEEKKTEKLSTVNAILEKRLKKNQEKENTQQ